MVVACVRLLVIDDGRGMNDEQIDIAMTVGGARNYRAPARSALRPRAQGRLVQPGAQRHRRIRRSRGRPHVGRQWQLTKAKQDYRCEIVDSAFAAALLAHDWGFPPSLDRHARALGRRQGLPDRRQASRRWNGSSKRCVRQVRAHLGLIFHRVLAASDLRLLLDVEDAGTWSCGRTCHRSIRSDTHRTGAAGWPRASASGAVERQTGARVPHLARTLERRRVSPRRQPDRAAGAVHLLQRPPRPARWMERPLPRRQAAESRRVAHRHRR